jgi:predicted RNase H-like HicB family nuclease
MENIEVKERTITKRSKRKSITSTSNNIKVDLDIYMYIDIHKEYDVYCPALRLATGGKTYDEALKAFDEVFQIHIDYCVEHKTLLEDLINHCGWEITNKTVKAPTIEQMMIKDSILKNTVRTKKYQKVTKTVSIPIYT